MTTATGFNAIVGQQHSIRLLKTFIGNGTLPHALLFTGDDGVGKKMTAMAFAMACNCLELKSTTRPHPDVIDACGTCIPCRKIAGNNHPDIIRVAPQSSVIKIARIRDLLQTLTLKPNEADYRVVILSDAQAMNAQASNALLKVLEEPPDRTLMVLTAHQPSDLLSTVASRCRHIRFSPLGAPEIVRLLSRIEGVEPGSAHTAAALCGGSFTRAQKLIDNRWLERQTRIIRALEHRLTDGGPPSIRAWLALSEMLAKKKDFIEESLETITIWLRDMLVVGHAPQRVFNQDRRDALAAAARHVAPARLIQQIDAVQGARTALRSNTNLRLTLDAMVLQMATACGTHTIRVKP